MMKSLLICGLVMSTLGMMAQAPAGAPAPKPGLTLTTTAFEDGGIIPNKYTMAAAQAAWVSPKLDWTNVPAGTVTVGASIKLFAPVIVTPGRADKSRSMPFSTFRAITELWISELASKYRPAPN